MARIKRFGSMTRVRNDLLPEADRAARAMVLRALTGTQTGPRGGRYEPFGETVIDTAIGDDFSIDFTLYRGRRYATYIRPKHGQ